MNIIADTHILLWALSDDARLTKLARQYLVDPGNEIYFSSISVWEIEMKHKLHPEAIKIDGKTFTDYCARSGFHPISFSVDHACNAESLNYPGELPLHKDPFDWAIISQAKTAGFMLMTHDKKIKQYEEPCILYV